ncbi:MAG: GNAT family N-acetyltransferase [Pseudomonadota bacterium]|nr:GNAT family N-acetyltransferase [Pseudomonadota bacterium]
MQPLSPRLATRADIPAITALMARAIDRLQAAFLSPAEIAASRAIMGLDTRLIDDGSYFVVETGRRVVGCGGWSRRATLYGGDHSAALRDSALLDPATEAARIRAMFTDPDFARRGIGRSILNACEDAARRAGFRRTELMATLSGEPLYRTCGYAAIERVSSPASGGVSVPLIRMTRPLD